MLSYSASRLYMPYAPLAINGLSFSASRLYVPYAPLAINGLSISAFDSAFAAPNSISLPALGSRGVGESHQQVRHILLPQTGERE